MSDDWLLKTIEAKSDQLNAVDLIGGAIVVTVRSVKQGPADQPVSIEIGDGRQPYKPCKSMRRLLVACWGKNASEWIGKRMTLFCDPTVKWAGEKVGGIRISHVSHIDKEREIPMLETRGKSRLWIVKPLSGTETTTSDRVANVVKAINEAKDPEAIDKIMQRAKQLYDSLDDAGRQTIDAAVDARFGKQAT